MGKKAWVILIWSPNHVNNPLHEIMQLLFKAHNPLMILNPKLLSAQFGGFKLFYYYSFKNIKHNRTIFSPL